MSDEQHRFSIQISLLFFEFLEYLVQIGYSDSIENLVEGVFQRAFFDEWVSFLAKRKLTGLPTTIEHIKEELMDPKEN
ncbi:MAG: hypothetical protein ACFFCQ_08385 [Promethearchaeota archaeon]